MVAIRTHEKPSQLTPNLIFLGQRFEPTASLAVHRSFSSWALKADGPS